MFPAANLLRMPQLQLNKKMPHYYGAAFLEMEEKMKLVSKLKKAVTLGLVIVIGVMMLQGCGSKSNEDIAKSMKEFEAEDGTFSISLDEKWEVEDLGMENWLSAFNKLGTEGVVIMQFPHDGMYAMESMEAMAELVEESYSYTGTDTDVPEIPGLTNLKASEGKITIEGSNIDGYVIYGESDYAYYGFIFAANNMSKSFIQEMKVSCGKFIENVPEVEDNTTVEITDTVRWFNASYAVLTEINGWDYNRFAGLPANDDNMAAEQESLEEWWGVTDRATADETLDWILTEGHRADFVGMMQILEEDKLGQMTEEERVTFILENYQNMDSDSAQYYADMYAIYEQNGATAIDGWDYCRAMNLLSFYYLAGYYTEQEALDKSLEIAQTMQPLFDSWDDLMESYMNGYEYWAEESADERRAVYDDLKTRDDSPYTVDFKMSLEKTW